jgi:hypothetical protein
MKYILNMFLCIFYITQTLEYEQNRIQKPILFTTTTYLAKNNKQNELTIALDSILQYNNYSIQNLVQEYMVINEYGENTTEIVEEFKKKYTQITFINKSKEQQGQAKSLNMIIDILKEGNYKYWVHWEESWYCDGSFLDMAYNIMEKSDISQLRLYPDCIAPGIPNQCSNNELNYKKYEHYTELIPTVSLEKKWEREYTYTNYCNYWSGGIWPLYSLRPHIIRVKDVLETGYFNEDPKKWPVTFEIEWAYRWILRKNKKGTMNTYFAKRQENHISTVFFIF